MNRKFFLLPLAVAAMALAACSGGDDYVEDNTTNNNENNNSGNNGDGGNTYIDSSGDDLETFDISFDTSSLTESETIPTDENADNYDDYLEHSTFSNTITIAYIDGSASVSGSVDGVTVATDGADVTVTSTAKKVEYILSGSCSDGSFKIYSDYKLKLTLNSLTLTNPTGAAINVQSKKRIFVNLNDGTTNTLTDGSSYNKVDGEDMKGCFFSEGQLLFSGSGSLTVNGNYKHGICSDDYILFRPGNNIYVATSKGNGIKANDGVAITGGVLNVSVSGDADKGISSDGYVTVNGGRTTIITTGGAEYDSDNNDVSACACIKADSIMNVTGGTLNLKSTGKGGKGINTDMDLTISGGTINILTTGTQYVYSNNLDASAKGMKSDANLTISGGTIKVRTSGGEGSEGIESKAVMNISGGTIEVSSYDDCLNATSAINISGGEIYAYSSGNDAIDSNGTLSVSGGTIICSGTAIPEGGIDCDQNTFAITGGTLVAMGGDNSTPTTSACKQPSLIYGGSGTAGAYISLLDSSSSPVITFKIPRSYSQMSTLISSPSMTQGSSYTLSIGGTPSGGISFHGLLSGNTWSGGSSSTSVTLSSMVTSVGSNGGNQPGGGDKPSGGGGQPGGGMGGH